MRERRGFDKAKRRRGSERKERGGDKEGGDRPAPPGVSCSFTAPYDRLDLPTKTLLGGEIRHRASVELSPSFFRLSAPFWARFVLPVLD